MSEGSPMTQQTDADAAVVIEEQAKHIDLLLRKLAAAEELAKELSFAVAGFSDDCPATDTQCLWGRARAALIAWEEAGAGAD